jgi:hypothetical protein
MDGATDSVILKSLHLQALVDDALASDGGVTVHNDRNGSVAVLVLAAKEVLLGAGAALDARVHSLQMGWVSHQGELDLVARVTVAAAEGSS